MWDSNDNYDVRDGARGVVRDTCWKGLILALENGQEAFAFFSGLRPGTEVFCTPWPHCLRSHKTMTKSGSARQAR